MIKNEEQQKVLLISITPRKLSQEDALKDLQELKSLVEAYGGEVVDLVVQNREIHDKGMYIGRGKMQEAADIIAEKKVNIVVLNTIARPGHLYDMKSFFQKQKPDIEVWDRVDLILEIFSKHARTAEAKLQIELAAMRHMGPRIYGMGMVMSRQTGGIGGRGIGETNTERMKRHWRDQMKKVQEKLDKITNDREQQLARRQRLGLKTISIIGYTNAGKTSLFNLLSGKKNLVENQLFVTLDSSIGKIFLPALSQDVLLTDTIGFIKNLPARLIDAFKSTLLESLHADLLLHVIDVSDSEMEMKIAVVERILHELNIGSKNRIYVFNKIDRKTKFTKKRVNELYGNYHPQYISVNNNEGIEKLVGTLEKQVMISENHTIQKSDMQKEVIKIHAG